MCLRKWDEYNAHAFRIFKFFKTFCEIGFVLNLGQEPHLFPASRVSLSAEKLTAFFIPPPLPFPPETKLYPAQSPEIYNYSTTIVICNKCTRFLYAIILQSSNISCTESRNLQHNHYNICQIYKTFKCNNRILQELHISCTESRKLQHNHYNICQMYKTFKCNNTVGIISSTESRTEKSTV